MFSRRDVLKLAVAGLGSVLTPAPLRAIVPPEDRLPEYPRRLELWGQHGLLGEAKWRPGRKLILPFPADPEGWEVPIEATPIRILASDWLQRADLFFEGQKVATMYASMPHPAGLLEPGWLHTRTLTPKMGEVFKVHHMKFVLTAGVDGEPWEAYSERLRQLLVEV